MPLQSLKSKFIFVIILICLVIGLATLLAFNASTDRIIGDLTLRFCTKEALLEKNKILSVIDREVALAQKMADDITLRKWAADENDPQLRQQAFAELESYRRLYRDKSFFIALAPSNHYYVYNKLDKSGRIDVATLQAGKKDDLWFFEGLQKIDSYALNLDYNHILLEAKVWFNAVMRDEQGRKTGICGGGINITDFLSEIVNGNEKGMKTILIDRSGVIQAHEDRRIVEHNANTRNITDKITFFSLVDDAPRKEQLRSAIESLFTGRSEVEAFPVRVGGKNYLLAVSYLKGVEWYNVVLVDATRVISMREFLPIATIMLLALLLSVALIGVMLTRMVLVPLKRLSDASREIAAGRYEIALPVTGRDELSNLTGSFNTMTATILDHTRNLETRVRERTDELSAANSLLKESQDKIIQSISYASMIQSSILPSPDSLERALGEHFVIYRPKEIVGGDFYYLREYPGHILTAVIDCTGHGVPGAFMTMTVNSVLNHVVDAVCCDNPALILHELNRMLQKTLHMTEVDAGLDIALCMIERETGRMTFAGAGLPLHIVSQGIVSEIRGNHQRIGYKGSSNDFVYDNHRLELGFGDCCYLTSDGLLDVPGGAKGYGFGLQRYRSMLVDHARLDMASQSISIQQVLHEYQGACRQRDDITLLGFRFSPLKQQQLTCS